MTDDVRAESNSTDRRGSAGPCAVVRQLAPLSNIDGWLRLYGAAVYGPASAAFSAQAHFYGFVAQRLAANPHVPMATVESAHQVHDLAVAVAEVSAGLFHSAIAPFLSPDARPIDSEGSR
jgi:hypothetical protein